MKRERLHPRSHPTRPSEVSLWRLRLRAVVRVLAVLSALVALLNLADYVAPPETDLLIVSGKEETHGRYLDNYTLEVGGSDVVSSVPVSKRLYLRTDRGDFVRVEHSRRLGLVRRVELLRGKRPVEAERLQPSFLAFGLVFIGLCPLVAWSTREEVLSVRGLASTFGIALVYVVLGVLFALDRYAG